MEAHRRDGIEHRETKPDLLGSYPVMMQTPLMITPAHGCVKVVVVVGPAVVLVVVVDVEVVDVVVLEVVVVGGVVVVVVVVVVVDVVVVAAVVVVDPGAVADPPTVDGTQNVSAGPKK